MEGWRFQSRDQRQKFIEKQPTFNQNNTDRQLRMMIKNILRYLGMILKRKRPFLINHRTRLQLQMCLNVPCKS